MYIETELEEVRSLINNHKWDLALGRIIELKAKRLVSQIEPDSTLIDFYMIYALYFKRANEKFDGLSVMDNYGQVDEMERLSRVVVEKMPEFYKAFFLRGLILERKAYCMIDMRGFFASIEITDTFNQALVYLNRAMEIKGSSDEIIVSKIKIIRAARAMFETLRPEFS